MGVTRKAAIKGGVRDKGGGLDTVEGGESNDCSFQRQRSGLSGCGHVDKVVGAPLGLSGPPDAMVAMPNSSEKHNPAFWRATPSPQHLRPSLSAA